jgi:integrase
MLFGGLRNSEVRRAQVDWLQQRQAERWIVVRVSKSARGVRWVPLAPDLWEELRRRATGDFLLAGRTATERRALVERELNRWIARVLPGRFAYDLRRQAGSTVLDAQGIEACMSFLGHQSADTPRRWYASRISLLKPIGELKPAAMPH